MSDLLSTDEGLALFIERCCTIGLNLTLRPSEISPDRPSVVVLQPHPDDVALSIGGILGLSCPRLSIVTLFSRSPDLLVTKEREREDQEFAQILNGQLTCLGFLQDSRRKEALNTMQLVRTVKRSLTPSNTRQLLMAPASVSRHEDHLLTRHVANELGCKLYWEDVAFWGIYASSIEDRVLFSQRPSSPGREFTLVAVDISKHIELKARMLRCYGTQSSDLWRPLRYAWTAAREIDAPFEYCERLFVHDDAISAIERIVGAKVVRIEHPLKYGLTNVRTGWISKQ